MIIVFKKEIRLIKKGGKATSGSYILEYLYLEIETYVVNAVRGSSYTPTPIKYSTPKCGLINIKNEDNECLRWCMLYQSKQVKK